VLCMGLHYDVPLWARCAHGHTESMLIEMKRILMCCLFVWFFDFIFCFVVLWISFFSFFPL
jgi:hypothetical protein